MVGKGLIVHNRYTSDKIFILILSFVDRVLMVWSFCFKSFWLYLYILNSILKYFLCDLYLINYLPFFTLQKKTNSTNDVLALLSEIFGAKPSRIIYYFEHYEDFMKSKIEVSTGNWTEHCVLWQDCDTLSKKHLLKACLLFLLHRLDMSLFFQKANEKFSI